jgi:DDE superfamily endonuclease
MFDLPVAMLSVLSIFLPLFFSKPSFMNFLELLQGHILCKGKRTISEILKSLSLRNVKNYSRYHDFFRKAKWSTLKGAEILLLYIVSLIPGDIEISVDSTVERRKGPKIKSLGIQRDAVRSNKTRKVLVPGLNWLVVAIYIKFPWCKQPWALPFLSILMPPENPLSTSKNENDLKRAKKHKTLNEWTCQIAILLRRWIKQPKKITIIADSAFATYILANTCIDLGITLVSRMRLDARTFNFPEENPKKGRKKLVGERLPTFKMILEDPSRIWDTAEILWYGGRKKKIDVLTGACLWYGYGIRPVPIRWVLTRDSNNKGEAAILFSTDVNALPIAVIEAFMLRWQIEVTFEEARRHLGMETQRQWSDNAIDRITPCILASYSIINLMALANAKSKGEDIPVQTSSWYKKAHVTFSDVLTYVRKKILRTKYMHRFNKNNEIEDIDLKEIIELLAAA